MKKTTLSSFLLLCFILILSCNSPVKTRLPKDSPIATISAKQGQPKIKQTQGAEYSQVGCGFMDKAGNLWFGTLGEGVYRYDGHSFIQFTTKDGLSDNNVNAILEDKAGNMLFGTNGGICRYDGKSITPFTKDNDPSKGSIRCLMEDRDENLWFGTMDQGVFRTNGKTFTNFLNKADPGGAFDRFSNEDSLRFNLGRRYQLIMDLLQDKNGNIWFSSWNGGGAWRFDGTSFTNYLPSKLYYRSNEDGRSGFNELLELGYTPPKDSITDDMIFSLAEDKAGNLWFATRRHGACRYDGKTFTTFTEHAGLANKGMYSILEDSRGNLWFTTEQDGVWRYDGKAFRNFTVKDGLVNNSVWTVLEDQNGNLWFGTRDFGLSRFDGKTFTTFSE